MAILSKIRQVCIQALESKSLRNPLNWRVGLLFQEKPPAYGTPEQKEYDKCAGFIVALFATTAFVTCWAFDKIDGSKLSNIFIWNRIQEDQQRQELTLQHDYQKELVLKEREEDQRSSDELWALAEKRSKKLPELPNLPQWPPPWVKKGP